MSNSDFLFTFKHGKIFYNIHRLVDGRYRFSPTNGTAYIVASWKDEIRLITNDKVDYS